MANLFGSGTQYADWQGANCDRCKRRTESDDQPPTCPLAFAIWEEYLGIAPVSAEIIERLKPLSSYNWPCGEWASFRAEWIRFVYGTCGERFIELLAGGQCPIEEPAPLKVYNIQPRIAWKRANRVFEGQCPLPVPDITEGLDGESEKQKGAPWCMTPPLAETKR